MYDPSHGRLPGKGVPSAPDIGINWVAAIGVSDTALDFSDSVNDRVVKAALGYQAEETVSLP
jgi:hypothetical protein